MNRARIARENAGLSIGQAAKMLDIERDELIRIEESDAAYAVSAFEPRMADLYHVDVAWLSGDGPRHEYATIDAMRGADRLTAHDRDCLAEFAASLPRRTS